MQIKRLFWAGLAATIGETIIMVDPLTKWSALTGRNGSPEEPEYTIKAHGARLALITHLHADHYHPDTLRTYLSDDGHVVCHHPLAQTVTNDGFTVVPVQTENSYQYGGFLVTAVPAVDGFGEDQVSWIIEGGGRRIIHCGDTLWHGYWWHIQQTYGPFDLAFLPMNGAILPRPEVVLGRLTKYTPSHLPASMTPEQAVAAGVILGAKAVCPIHYGLDVELYREYPHALQNFISAAQKRDLPVVILQPGEEVHWDRA